MKPFAAFLGLPSSLLLLIAAQVASQDVGMRLPTAIRKMSLDEGEKLFPEYMAFEEEFYAQAPLSPREAAAAAQMARDADEALLLATNATIPYRPPFAQHEDERKGLLGWELFRRAAEALSLLQGRQACPSGMSSCLNIGYPNKCCMSNEVCVQVTDTMVGHVACCPQGITCSGSVGPCGSGATSCPAELGGGCCIPGFVCQGVGCKYLVPRPNIPEH
jgi:progranulin